MQCPNDSIYEGQQEAITAVLQVPGGDLSLVSRAWYPFTDKFLRIEVDRLFWLRGLHLPRRMASAESVGFPDGGS
jgi:hypothetical protein